jgi:hypothetical protein
VFFSSCCSKSYSRNNHHNRAADQLSDIFLCKPWSWLLKVTLKSKADLHPEFKIKEAFNKLKPLGQLVLGMS